MENDQTTPSKSGAELRHPQDITASAPLSRMQLVAIAVCVLINMVDGFDVLAIAFTAPVIGPEWNVGPAELGIVFAAGGLGMALGAIFLGPLADSFGRRPLVMAGLVLASLGMFASSLAESVTFLLMTRIVTGAGIGAILASLNTLVAEYSSDKHRNMAITLLHLGYPIGGALGGIAASILISQFGWQSVFLAGMVLSLIMLVVTFAVLPESIDFLVTSRRANALPQLNRIMLRMGHNDYESLPPPLARDDDERSGIRRVWTREFLLPNVLLPLAFFMLMFHLYFVLQWMPKMVVELGFSVDRGIQVGTMIAFLSAAGMLCFGFLSTKFGLRKVVSRLSVVAAIAMLMVGAVPTTSFTVLVILIGLMALTHAGLMPGLYAIAPQVYPAAVRATGISMAIGIARLGTILGPAFAGFLLAAGSSAQTTIMIYAIPLIVPALIIPFVLSEDGIPPKGHGS